MTGATVITLLFYQVKSANCKSHCEYPPQSLTVDRVLPKNMLISERSGLQRPYLNLEELHGAVSFECQGGLYVKFIDFQRLIACTQKAYEVFSGYIAYLSTLSE